MSIGTKIKEYRTKLGLTQKDLAEKLCVTYQAVSRWENDEVEPSIETIKEMAKLFSCTTDELMGFENNNQIKEEKPEDKTTIIKEKVVLGICEKCSKPIFEPDDLIKFEETYHVRRGRSSHKEVRQVILCKECNEKRLENEKIEKEKERKLQEKKLKNKRIHSFIWPSILAALLLVISIIQFVKGNSGAGTFLLILALFTYPFLATMILNNTFVSDVWLEVSTWGFVKMPGVIFTFDFGGIVFLITVKLFLFLLGLALALGSFALATVIAMILSIFVYPYALNKNIKGKELEK